MNAFLRSAAMLTLLRTAAEMLLPEGNLRRLCDTVLGPMTTACLLTALRELLSGWTG